MKLLKKILEPFTFRKPASFEFSGSVDEGVRLLSEHVKSPVFFSPHDFLFGKVSESKVSFWHYRPLKQQLVTATFTGQFTTEDNKTILDGEFAMHKWQKLTYMFLGICVLLLSIFLCLVLHFNNKDSILSLLFLFGPSIFGLTVVHINYNLAKIDIKYIEDKLTTILKKRPI